MANYINTKKLEKEIILSKENDELTKEAAEMLMRMVREIIKPMSYKNPEDRNDCMSEAYFDIVKYWRSFNPLHENANCFSFYTQLIKNGLAKGFKKIKNPKKIQIVAIDESDGIYNI